jgi:hypothetical protein
MKKLVSLLITLVIVIGALSSCFAPEAKINIGVMSGPTGMGMSKLMADTPDDSDKYGFKIYADPTIGVADLQAGTLDMLSASSSKDMSKEEKIEASQKLLNSITPESAEMLGSMMTPAMLESIGVSSENSEAISSTVSSLLENMANYETGESSGDASREAEAVNTILDIALNGASADGALFNGDGGDGALGASAEELVDLVMSSEVISGTLEEVVNQNGYSDNPMGIPELSEADSAQLSAAIEAYYAAGGNDPEMASQLEALAAILNLNIELD